VQSSGRLRVGVLHVCQSQRVCRGKPVFERSGSAAGIQVPVQNALTRPARRRANPNPPLLPPKDALSDAPQDDPREPPSKRSRGQDGCDEVPVATCASRDYVRNKPPGTRSPSQRPRDEVLATSSATRPLRQGMARSLWRGPFGDIPLTSPTTTSPRQGPSDNVPAKDARRPGPRGKVPAARSREKSSGGKGHVRRTMRQEPCGKVPATRCLWQGPLVRFL